jgi:hypothetical protein
VIGEIVLLAVAAAINPTMLAVVLVLLTLPQRRSLMVGYLAGGLVVSTAIGIAVVGGVAGTGILEDEPKVGPGVDLIAGIVVLILTGLLAIRFRRHPPRPPDVPKPESRTERVLRRGTKSVALLIGAITNLPGLYYIVALKDIAQTHASTVERIVEVMVFNLIMFLPAIVPLVLLAKRPDTTQAQMERISMGLGRLTRRYGRPAVLVVGVGIGVYLVVKGAIHI